MRPEQREEKVEESEQAREDDNLPQQRVASVVVSCTLFQGNGFERFEYAIGLRGNDFAPIHNTFSGLDNAVGEGNALQQIVFETVGGNAVECDIYVEKIIQIALLQNVVRIVVGEAGENIFVGFPGRLQFGDRDFAGNVVFEYAYIFVFP